MGCKKQQACRQALRRWRDQRAQPFAGGTVSDLIMVLNGDDETIAGKSGVGTPVTTVAMRAVASVQDECILQQLRKLFRRSIVLIISLSFAGEGDMHEMMKIVAPLRVDPIAALLRRKQKADIIEIAFGHDVDLASEFSRSPRPPCP